MAYKPVSIFMLLLYDLVYGIVLLLLSFMMLSTIRPISMSMYQ